MSTDVWVQVPLLAPNTFLFSKEFNIAGLCKGSTADSDSVCLGSNPSPAAMKKDICRCLFSVVFVPFGTISIYFVSDNSDIRLRRV